MRNTIFSVLFLCGAGALVLLAADSWRKKPYTAWDDAEVQKILNDSPWAREVDLISGDSGDVAHSISPLAGGGGGGGEGGMGGRGGGNEADGPRAPSLRLVVRFVSALPVRQAMLRARYGDQVGDSAAAKALSTPDNYYVVALAGLRRLPADVQVIKEKSSLRAKGKNPFGPALVLTEKGMLVLFFPREGHPVAVEDGEVEVQVRLPDLVGPVRRSFKLKDMVYDGKLEL